MLSCQTHVNCYIFSNECGRKEIPSKLLLILCLLFYNTIRRKAKIHFFGESFKPSARESCTSALCCSRFYYRVSINVIIIKGVVLSQIRSCLHGFIVQTQTNIRNLNIGCILSLVSMSKNVSYHLYPVQGGSQ